MPDRDREVEAKRAHPQQGGDLPGQDYLLIQAGREHSNQKKIAMIYNNIIIILIYELRVQQSNCPFLTVLE